MKKSPYLYQADIEVAARERYWKEVYDLLKSWNQDKGKGLYELMDKHPLKDL